MSARSLLIAMAFALLPITAAYAQTQQPVPIPPIPLAGTADAFRGMASGTLGAGKIGDAWYLRLNLGTEFDFGKIGVGIQVPLNIRLTDRCIPGANPGDPSDCRFNSTLRKEDWDEVADYARIIRYFRFGRPSDTFYLRVGELAGAIFGHGTVVNGYYNAINLDIYKLGIQINVNTAYGGVQTLMDNLMRPSVFGARAYVRPVSFFDKTSYANNLAVGFTLVGDAFAPVGTAGAGTSASEPSFARAGAVVMGFDVEFAVLRTRIIDVIPYTDLNFLLGGSPGWHLGVLTKLRPLKSFGLNVRLEYRYLGQQYLPGYFDSYYDIQRYDFPSGCARTKFDYVRGHGGPLPDGCRAVGLSGSGLYAEGVFNFFDLVRVIMAFEDASGPNNSNLLLSLQLPAFDAVKLAVYYYKRFFEGISNAFSLDDAVFVAEARVRLYGPLAWQARYTRSWTLAPDGASFVSTDDFSVGIGVYARF